MKNTLFFQFHLFLMPVWSASFATIAHFSSVDVNYCHDTTRET